MIKQPKLFGSSGSHDHDDKCRYKHFSSSQVPIKSNGQTIALRSVKLRTNGDRQERGQIQLVGSFVQGTYFFLSVNSLGCAAARHPQTANRC